MVYGLFAPQTFWFDDESFNRRRQPQPQRYQGYYQPIHRGNQYSNFRSYPDDEDYCMDCQPSVFPGNPSRDFWQNIPVIRLTKGQRNGLEPDADIQRSVMPKRQISPSNRVLRPRKSKSRCDDQSKTTVAAKKEEQQPSGEDITDTSATDRFDKDKENVADSSQTSGNEHVYQENDVILEQDGTVNTSEFNANNEDATKHKEYNQDSLMIERRIHEIDEVIEEANELSNNMNSCIRDAKLSMKEYAYYEEMLTKCLLKLDSILTNGIDNIRLHRKRAVELIENTLSTLEKPNK